MAWIRATGNRETSSDDATRVRQRDHHAGPDRAQSTTGADGHIPQQVRLFATKCQQSQVMVVHQQTEGMLTGKHDHHSYVAGS